MSTLVTIGIPTYQRPEYLRAAVVSALSQSHRHLQVVVSDNASPVKASTVLADIADKRLKIHEYATTIPAFDNWDNCVAMADGEYFLLLSDDDVLYPTAIETLIAGFQGNDRFAASQIGVSYGRCRAINDKGAPIKEGPLAPQVEGAPEAVLGFFNSERPTQPCGLMMRTADIRALGGYAPRSEVGIVRDAKVWILIALKRGGVHFSSNNVADYRVHAVSGTFQADLEEALQNNLALADLCGEVLTDAGNAIYAKKISVASRRLNSRVFMTMMRSQSKYKGSPASAFREFLRLRAYFLSVQTLPTAVFSAMRIFSPKSIARALKGKW